MPSLSHVSQLLRLAGPVVLLTAASPGVAQDPCLAILRDGAFNTFQVRNETDLHREMTTRLRRSMQSKQSSDARFALGALVPFQGIPVQFNTEYSKEKAQEISAYLESDEETLLTEHDMYWLLSKTASSEITTAWLECVRAQSRGDVKSSISGDPTGDFILSIQWNPTYRGDYPPAPVRSINLANVAYRGDSLLVRDEVFQTYTGLAQSFRRIDPKKPAAIVVNFEGVTAIQVDLPAITPQPLYVTRMRQKDENGDLYSETFSVTHSDNRDGYSPQSGRYQLRSPQGRIYRVTYRCSSNRGSGRRASCGWSRPRRGPLRDTYSADVEVDANGRGLTWYRDVGAESVTETYTVYFEKPVRVCVENCPGSSHANAESPSASTPEA